MILLILLIRLLIILFVGCFMVFIGFPFLIIMMLIGIFSILPIAIITFVISGDIVKSFDKAFQIGFEIIIEKIGFFPFVISSKILGSDKQTNH